MQEAGQQIQKQISALTSGTTEVLPKGNPRPYVAEGAATIRSKLHSCAYGFRFSACGRVLAGALRDEPVAGLDKAPEVGGDGGPQAVRSRSDSG